MFNFLFRSLLFLIFALPSPTLFSQGVPGQWVGGDYLVNANPLFPKAALLDENNKAKKKFPLLSEVPDFPVPAKYLKFQRYVTCFDGTFYTTAFGNIEKEKDGTEIQRFIFAKWEDETWRYIGSLFIRPDVIQAIPCGNDRFIVISIMDDLTGNHGSDSTPFCRISLKPDKQEFKIERAIPLQMFDFATTVGHRFVALTDEYATVINRNTGLYWIFSLEKASLTRTGRLFSKVTDEMIKRGGFEGAIFEAHPEKDGNILISAQDDYLFTTGKSRDISEELMEMRKSNPNMTQEEVKKFIEMRSNERKDRSPFFVWYRIFPESGKVEKLSHPPEGGTLLRKDLYIWRPMPDGSIKMGDFTKDFSSFLTAASPKPANADAKKDDKAAK
jgi:hypothetical protein